MFILKEENSKPSQTAVSARLSTASISSDADGDDMPPTKMTKGRMRRGAVSAEVCTEAEATHYIKKVDSIEIDRKGQSDQSMGGKFRRGLQTEVVPYCGSIFNYTRCSALILVFCTGRWANGSDPLGMPEELLVNSTSLCSQLLNLAWFNSQITWDPNRPIIGHTSKQASLSNDLILLFSIIDIHFCRILQKKICQLSIIGLQCRKFLTTT